jgi:glycosyltransferase involved in cell wall biosynthesis
MLDAALKFLHRHVWRRLPRRLRRAALLRAAVWRAPRITQNAKARTPVIVVGWLRQVSGLGAAARACHDALKATGLSTYGIDLTRAFLHEENHADFAFADGRELIGQGTAFLHVSGPLVPLSMAWLGSRFVRHKRFIAHWFWELSRLPDDWRFGVPFVHEICVNTRFVAEAVATIAGRRPVHVVPYPLVQVRGIARAPTGEATHNADRPFTALVVFNVASNFMRKNPCASIQAFRKAFGDDSGTRLIVKYSNAAFWPQGLVLLQRAADGACNIDLIGETLSAAGMDALYGQADVVLSLHRAEGFGLVIAEAMLRGLPVIATDWSGNTDFLTRETGLPIGYDFVPVDDPQGNYGGQNMLWANPHVDAAAAMLRILRADSALRRRLGAAAAEAAAKLFHPARYADEVRKMLDLGGTRNASSFG